LLFYVKLFFGSLSITHNCVGQTAGIIVLVLDPGRLEYDYEYRFTEHEYDFKR